MSFIEFQHVKKIYGGKNEVEIRALDDASFSVEKGELAVILGGIRGRKDHGALYSGWHGQRH